MRKTWNQYFMTMAQLVAERATCDRLHVGCIFVRDHNVISTGYNGSISRLEHCDDAGHDMKDGHCVRTVHAEMNAICSAAKNGVPLERSNVYITHFPCLTCFKLLAQVGAKHVYYLEEYKTGKDDKERIEKLAMQKDISLTKIEV